MKPEEIKALREKMGLNQWDFGRLLGVSGTSVSKWEKGKRNISKPVLILLQQLKERG